MVDECSVLDIKIDIKFLILKLDEGAWNEKWCMSKQVLGNQVMRYNFLMMQFMSKF